MPDEPLTNRCVEWMRFGIHRLNSANQPPPDLGLTDDFVFQDGRSGVNFGRIEGSDAYREWLASTWEVGSNHPLWSIPDVVAVRDDRCAVVVMKVDYGNEMWLEHLECWRLDATLRRAEFAAAFDADDRDAAIAELDRLSTEIDD